MLENPDSISKAVLNKGLQPICVTESKLYATWGDAVARSGEQGVVWRPLPPRPACAPSQSLAHSAPSLQDLQGTP